jgi:methylated-DNA-[protein]-cysteine S-methyltransferase
MTPTPTYVYWSTVEHERWTLRLAATDKGLCCVTLPNESFESLQRWVKKHVPCAVLVKDDAKMAPYTRQLVEYFSGRRKEFTCPLDLRGTPFQIRVWHALRQIPFGEVRSYSDIAASIGQPTAVRAVGAAIGANPIPIVIPCQRVIGKDGSLTGFRGGLDIKAELLRWEGLEPAGLQLPLELAIR